MIHEIEYTDDIDYCFVKHSRDFVANYNLIDKILRLTFLDLSTHKLKSFFKYERY